MTRTAVQQIMIGSISGTEEKAASVLAAIAEAGYDGIELNDFMCTPTPFVVRMLTRAAGMPVGKGGKLDWPRLVREAGLEVVSLHTNLGALKEHPERFVEQARGLGTKTAVITGMYRFDYSDRAAVEGLARDLDVCGKRLAEDGIELLYHNHNCEFRKVAPGTTAYDLLLEATDPAFVNFEFDSYWPAEAGVDALGLMRRLGDRMKLYHINDRGTRIEGASMTPILASDSMELGCGNMPLEELVAQALAVDVEAIVLETHKNWVDKSPVKSLEVSGTWLKEHVAR